MVPALGQEEQFTIFQSSHSTLPGPSVPWLPWHHSQQPSRQFPCSGHRVTVILKVAFVVLCSKEIKVNLNSLDVGLEAHLHEQNVDWGLHSAPTQGASWAHLFFIKSDLGIGKSSERHPHPLARITQFSLPPYLQSFLPSPEGRFKKRKQEKCKTNTVN